MEQYYYKEITEEAYKELVNFAEWMNKYFGYHPTIVGGWAVWCYTKDLGSRDIDVVFLSPQTRDTALIHYLKHNGYEEKGTLFERSYVKKIKTKKREEEIIIDACTIKNKIITNLNINLPWSWAHEYVNQFKINSIGIYIPLPELLIVYKIAAIIGRADQLNKTADPVYLEAKIWKDIHDIISLFKKVKLETGKIKFFLKKSNLINYKNLLKKEFDLRSDLLKERNFKTKNLGIFFE